MKDDIELLRYAVRLFDKCNETFNQGLKTSELIKIARCHKACEWDFYPDQWTVTQLQNCLYFGYIPEFEEVNGKIVAKERL